MDGSQGWVTEKEKVGEALPVISLLFPVPGNVSRQPQAPALEVEINEEV